jgi:hypothetical protein
LQETLISSPESTSQPAFNAANFSENSESLRNIGESECGEHAAGRADIVIALIHRILLFELFFSPLARFLRGNESRALSRRAADGDRKAFNLIVL